MRKVDWLPIVLFVMSGIGFAWAGANIGPKIREQIQQIQDPEERGLTYVSIALLFNSLMLAVRPK